MANPYQPVLGVAEIRMQYLLDGEHAENVYHVTNGTLNPWGLAQLEDLASTFIAWEDTTASGARNQAAVLNSVIVTDLTSLNALRIIRPVIPQVSGGLTGEEEPNNVTLAIKFDTGTRGRGKQGRTFWIGVDDSQTAGNQITTAARDSILSALLALKDDLLALNPEYDLVVVHRVINNIRPPQADFAVVLSFTVTDMNLDTQKNRLPGHKRSKRRVIPAP